jgi:hypothetical protein
MNTNKCGWCGLYHGPTCPRVAAIEYHPNGLVKRVEFFDAKGANGRREFNVGTFAERNGVGGIRSFND